jgi:hypothetical protein
MQGPAGAPAPELAAASPFSLEAPCLGQQTAGIHLLPLDRRAPLSRPLTIPRISRVTEGFVSRWGRSLGVFWGAGRGLGAATCRGSATPPLNGML